MPANAKRCRSVAHVESVNGGGEGMLFELACVEPKVLRIDNDGTWYYRWKASTPSLGKALLEALNV